MCAPAQSIMVSLAEQPQRAVSYSNLAFYVLLFGLYLSLNSVLNLANRWALGLSGFTFPILLTMAHAIFSFSILGPILSARKVDHVATLRKSWKGILLIGILMGCNIACNNLSLVHLPLSINQVTRASLPVVTAAVAVLVEKKIPSRSECMALILLTMGVGTTVYEGKALGSGAGLMLCCAGVLCAAAMLSTAGLVLSEKLDVLQLTFYTAPVSFVMLLPIYIAREHTHFLGYMKTNQQSVTMIVMLSSFVALAYNITHNYLLQRTSAVTVTVLGEIKIIGLLLLSATLLPGESSHFTAKMTIGCVLAITGFCLYSNAKIAAQKAPSRTQLPLTSQQDGFTQEKLLEVVTADKSQRTCGDIPLFSSLFSQATRRSNVPAKMAKASKGTTYVVADSSSKQPLLSRASSSGSTIQDDQVYGKNGYQSYLATPSASPFLTSTTLRNGEKDVLPPGKVRAVPDQSVLEIPPPSTPGQLAPRSYEALQVFDAAPRGFSLVQPV